MTGSHEPVVDSPPHVTERGQQNQLEKDHKVHLLPFKRLLTFLPLGELVVGVVSMGFSIGSLPRCAAVLTAKFNQ